MFLEPQDVQCDMQNFCTLICRESNMGLVKQVLASLYKKNIQRLTKTFLTLSLSDVASRVQLSGPSDAEKYILNMVSVTGFGRGLYTQFVCAVMSINEVDLKYCVLLISLCCSKCIKWRHSLGASAFSATSSLKPLYRIWWNLLWGSGPLVAAFTVRIWT